MDEHVTLFPLQAGNMSVRPSLAFEMIILQSLMHTISQSRKLCFGSIPVFYK